MPRKTCKFRLSRNSTKFNVLARFRETIPMVKSVLSFEIQRKNFGFLTKLQFCNRNYDFAIFPEIGISRVLQSRSQPGRKTTIKVVLTQSKQPLKASTQQSYLKTTLRLEINKVGRIPTSWSVVKPNEASRTSPKSEKFDFKKSSPLNLQRNPSFLVLTRSPRRNDELWFFAR